MIESTTIAATQRPIYPWVFFLFFEKDTVVRHTGRIVRLANVLRIRLWKTLYLVIGMPWTVEALRETKDAVGNLKLLHEVNKTNRNNIMAVNVYPGRWRKTLSDMFNFPRIALVTALTTDLLLSVTAKTFSEGIAWATVFICCVTVYLIQKKILNSML